MQYANDINKYTLASTATLRELETQLKPGTSQHIATTMELQSRIPGESIQEKNAQIEGLQDDLGEVREERNEAQEEANGLEDDLRDEESEHDKTKKSLQAATAKLAEHGIEFEP